MVTGRAGYLMIRMIIEPVEEKGWKNICP